MTRNAKGNLHSTKIYTAVMVTGCLFILTHCSDLYILFPDVTFYLDN